MTLKPSLRTDAEAWAIVAENTALVWWTINRWYRRLNGDGAARDDAYGCGVLGLFRACQLWNPDAGTLSTYATAWIRQSIDRGLVDVEDRRASARGDELPMRRASLNMLIGTNELGDLWVAADRPDLDAEWPRVVDTVAAKCTSPIARDIANLIANGVDESYRAIGERHGITPEGARRSALRVRHMYAVELGYAHLTECNVDGCQVAAMTLGKCNSHDTKARRRAKQLVAA